MILFFIVFLAAIFTADSLTSMVQNYDETQPIIVAKHTYDMFDFEKTKDFFPVVDGCTIEHFESNLMFTIYTGFDAHENVLYNCDTVTISAGVQIGDYFHNILTSLDVAEEQDADVNIMHSEYLPVNGKEGQYIIYQINDDNPIVVLTWYEIMHVKIYSSYNTDNAKYWDGYRDETVYQKHVHNFVTFSTEHPIDQVEEMKEFLFKFT